MTTALHALLLAFAVSMPLATAACAGETDPSEDATEGDEQDVTGASSVKLGEADDGKTVPVKVGKSVVLTLPSNASTGYSWKVTSTDRTFGYPTEKFVSPRSGAVGASGSQRFTWKTSGPLPMQGAHTVTLEYARGNGAPAKSFTFTAEVVDDDTVQPAPAGDVVAGESDDGKTLDLASGKSISLTLPSNASTGYSWSVASTDRTFGYPKEEAGAPAGGPVGSGGTQKFTWRTDGPLPMTGTHTVELHYKRSWETAAPPAKTFKLVVRIQ